MNYSFKDYATQFAKFTLPVGAIAVGKPLFPPMSLREIMNQGAPYVPDLSIFGFVDNSNNPSLVAFFWADDANLPPWDNLNFSPNPLRMATSWRFQLWEAVGGAQLIDVTLLLSALQADGSVQYDYEPGLDGNYLYQITAFNNYGSASTAKVPVTITLPSGSPTLTVQRSPTNTNSFVIAGAGFKAGASVTLEVDGGVGSAHTLSPPPQLIAVGGNGKFQTAAIACQSLCTLVDGGTGGGGALRFEAIVNGTVVATHTSSCVAT